MNGKSLIAAALLSAALIPSLAFSHCQVPCGIYDDAARIALLFEDATTIGKGVLEIKKLATAQDANGQNQLTRWIMNKEKHASNIITVVTEYFLAQRVKPVAPDTEGYEDYLKKVADHHAVIVAAMKTKQSADPVAVQALHEALNVVATHYDTAGHDH